MTRKEVNEKYARDYCSNVLIKRINDIFTDLSKMNKKIKNIQRKIKNENLSHSRHS